MGAEPEQFGRAAAELVDHGYDLVDINFGCPVKKVLGRCRAATC
jgi:tRNA-dihydrouridine synthase